MGKIKKTAIIIGAIILSVPAVIVFLGLGWLFVSTIVTDFRDNAIYNDSKNTYINKVGPALNSYFNQYGEYPRSLDQLSSLDSESIKNILYRAESPNGVACTYTIDIRLTEPYGLLSTRVLISEDNGAINKCDQPEVVAKSEAYLSELDKAHNEAKQEIFQIESAVEKYAENHNSTYPQSLAILGLGNEILTNSFDNREYRYLLYSNNELLQEDDIDSGAIACAYVIDTGFAAAFDVTMVGGSCLSNYLKSTATQ